MNEKQISMVFIVTLYNNIQGVYANQKDASDAQMLLASKGRISDVICRPVIYNQNFESNE